MAGTDAGSSRRADRPVWKRVVLKLSGEALAEPTGFGLDNGVLHQVATEIKDVRDNLKIDVAVVVGGGNFWRGLKGAGQGMDQAQADFMGMIATVINGLALQDALERVGQQSRVMTAIEMPKVAEPYIRRGLSATWKRVALSFSLVERVIRSSRQTPQPLCELLKSMLRPS